MENIHATSLIDTMINIMDNGLSSPSMKTVVARASGPISLGCPGDITNTHLICAERNLVRQAVRVSIKRGVPSHRLVAWLRSRIRHITVERPLADGTLGCSCPCMFCRRVLDPLQLKVTYTAHGGQECRARTNNLAPTTKVTRGRVERLY